MIIHFEKKIECPNTKDNHELCHKQFLQAIQKLLPQYEDGKNGHISISHNRKENHKFWVTLYEKGKHENYRDGKSIKTKFNEIQKKYSGPLPTEEELKNLIYYKNHFILT